MRSTTRTSAAALGCALLLLVTGCSNDGPGDDASKGAGSEAEVEVGPLSAYFERIAGDQDEEDWNRLAQESEEIVATCMREQGFEYTPQDMSQSMTMVTSDDGDGPEWGTAEYAAEFGYGMTTQMDAGTEVEGEETEEWVDPNADYVAGMSETEQQAFYEALYGAGMDYDESDPDAAAQEYSWETAGCQGKGQHETYDTGINAAYSDPSFASLQEEMNKVWESSTSDPAMTAIDAEWSSCMADAGFDFATPQDAMDSVSAQMDAIFNATYENVDENATEAPEMDPAAVAAANKTEIETAVADHACKESTDYDARAQEVQFAAEQAFVDAHRAELDAWAEKYSQADE